MPNITDQQIAELKEYADDLDAARREGVIEGLEQALSLFPPANSTTQWNPQDAIRAEIDGMKRES